MNTTDDDDLRSRARFIPTTLLSDILADHGFHSQVLATNVQAIHPNTPRTAGWAYTISGRQMSQNEHGPDFTKARAIDETPQGSMMIWAGNGVDDVCMFGDLLAHAMRVRGAAGAVVDGGVRDVDDIDPDQFPVFARYRTPKASTSIWCVSETQATVRVTGVLGRDVEIAPGDLVVADVNGVAVIPCQVVEKILVACETHLARETEIRSKIEGRESIEALLREYGRI